MIFITGDLHGANNLWRFDEEHFPIQKELTKNDYIIILGDFGIPWNDPQSDAFDYEWEKLEELNNKSFTTLFIDGNHENFSNLESFSEIDMFGSKVGKIRDSIFHLKRGNVYIIENLKFFTFGGALSIDKSYRIPYHTWWPQELPSKEEINNAFNNLDKNNYEVDYVLTHTLCRSLLSKLFDKDLIYQINDPVQDFLDIINTRLKFNKWFFGHFHFNKIIDNKYYLLYEDIIQLT